MKDSWFKKIYPTNQQLENKYEEIHLKTRELQYDLCQGSVKVTRFDPNVNELLQKRKEEEEQKEHDKWERREI